MQCTTPEQLTQGCPTPGPEQLCRPLTADIPTKKDTHVANIKSQLKRIKTNRTRTERNKAVKSELRTWIRKFREAAASGDKDAASDALKIASKKLDKAVTKGVIHKNQAANKKAAMAKRANSL
jgi:small subunit ribosomal protein S20